jgi:DNA polymerase III alpha subunit (gram-positive type)
MKNIVCIDVETTGLDPKNDYIIQLAAVKIDGSTLELMDRKQYFIKPC